MMPSVPASVPTWLIKINWCPSRRLTVVLTNRIDLPSLHDLEPDVSVVLVVRETGQGGADAGVDVGVVPQQALHGGVVEVGAVVDGGNLAGRTAEDFGFPCITESILLADRSVDVDVKRRVAHR